MADDQLLPPGKVPGSDGIKGPKGFEKETPIKPNQESFQSFMNEPTAGKQPTAVPEESSISPMDLAKEGKPQISGVSYDSLLGVINDSKGHLNTLQNQLNTPNLKLKHAHSRLINSKLQEAKNHINAASEKLGVPVEETKVPNGSSPLVKFLSYVTDGQKQIEKTQAKLHELSTSGKPISPADMLLVQVNLAKGQQELEYSSILLGKTIEVIKQIINIQI